MPISLHAAVIPSFVQILDAGRGWLDKVAASSMAEEECLQARLTEDMLPFTYQVRSMTDHSQGAIEAMREGVFRPKFDAALPASIAEMRDKLAGASVFLAHLDPAELEGFIGRPMRFEIGAKRLDFTAEDFLLSFSQPNFYFHAATAYGILRHHGITVGKLDYLGKLRMTVTS